MTHSLDDLIVKLELVLRSLIKSRNDFDAIWNCTVRDFKNWISKLPASISPFTRNMEILRLICIAFDNENIRNDDNIKKLIIVGTIAEGNTLNLDGIKYEVIGRQITDRGGVLFELRDEKGKMRQHEFFE